MWEWLEGKKTVIFNLLTLAAALIVAYMPLLKEDNAETALRILLYANVGINVILRTLFTNGPSTIMVPKTLLILMAVGLFAFAPSSAYASHRRPVRHGAAAVVQRVHQRPHVLRHVGRAAKAVGRVSLVRGVGRAIVCRGGQCPL